MGLAAVWLGAALAVTNADLHDHAVRQTAFWQRFTGKPLAERVFPCPPELADFLDLDNRFYHFDGKPRALPVPDAAGADARAVLAALPPAFAKRLSERLIGVFFVDGLGSTAYTEFTRGAHDAADQAFIVLDAGALTRNANAWISWKESSAFKADAHVRVEGTIAAPAEDDRRHALGFVLIHELAHAFAFAADVHPLWNLPADKAELAAFPFAALSWQAVRDRYATKVDRPGPIIYYRDDPKKAAAAEAPAYYDWLAASPFPTLYAATNPFDDFADSVATYLHTELYGRPFELRVVQDGKVVRRVGSCWQEARCAAKRKLLERALGLTAP